MATEPEIPYYLSFAAKILIFSETAKGISLFQHRDTPGLTYLPYSPL